MIGDVELDVIGAGISLEIKVFPPQTCASRTRVLAVSRAFTRARSLSRPGMLFRVAPGVVVLSLEPLRYFCVVPVFQRAIGIDDDLAVESFGYVVALGYRRLRAQLGGRDESCGLSED